MTDENKSLYKLRIIAVVLIFVGLLIAFKMTGLSGKIDTQTVRAAVEKAGVGGFALYVAAFTGGEFIHIPGMIFVAAGILVYGRLPGFFASFTASMVSISFCFLAVRLIGGRSLKKIEWPVVQKLLAGLNAHPIRTVALLRIFLWLAPPLNYTLALTDISFRDYAIGSFIGLLPVLGGAALFLTGCLPEISYEGSARLRRKIAEVNTRSTSAN